ncbi:MAG: pilus assembly protein [Lachnospiraceae bacterium]|nr:pilus assembly protein [Lachnospiraceae bacterium]
MGNRDGSDNRNNSYSHQPKKVMSQQSDNAMRRKWSVKKASATVETAMVIPVILIVVFGLLYLDFHTQNSMVCLSAAAEQAISGQTHEDLVTFGNRPVRGISEDAASRTVSFETSIRTIYGAYQRTSRHEASYDKLYPVSFIRKMKTVGDIFGS